LEQIKKYGADNSGEFQKKDTDDMPMIYFKSQEKMMRSDSPEIAKYIDVENNLNFDDFEESKPEDEEIEETFDYRQNLADLSDDEIPLEIDFDNDEDLKSQQLYN
jgi:hypothetical protein